MDLHRKPAATKPKSSSITGGNFEMIETISKAAIATGADGLFIETYLVAPSHALRDRTDILKHDIPEELFMKLVRLRKQLIDEK